MLLSNSVNNGDNPISSVEPSFLQNPFFNEEDHLHLPVSFFHSPPPFQDNEAFHSPNHELFLCHLQQSLLKPSEAPSIPNNHKPIHTTPQDDQIPRRKSWRKDRHSKINTLKGPRYRRMRLSLSVARDLFGLQEMLGVDKASKTVEWLLIQSKPAIKKLEKDFNGGVVSLIDEDHSIQGNQLLFNKEMKKMRTKRLRNLSFPPLSKHSRDKARARARARTEKKQQTRSSLISIIDDLPDIHNRRSSCDLSRISSSLIGFETRVESGSTQSNIINPFLEVPSEFDQQTSSNSIARKLDQLVNDSSITAGNWSPSSTFSSLHRNGFSSQEFEECPLVGKSWNLNETNSILRSHLQEQDLMNREFSVL